MKIDFTIEDIEKIRKLNAEGKSLNAIGAEFGCGYGPIQRVYRELGLKPQVEKATFTPEQIDLVKQMLIDETPVKEIGKAFGKSQTPIPGRGNYYCDFDSIISNEDTIESMAMEYTFIHGERKTVALIDWKQGIAESIPCKQNMEAIKQQAYFASHEMKTPLPFFIGLTFLLEEHTTKMYFMLPANKPARRIIPSNGKWMTLFAMSKFQHFIRNRKFDPDEIIFQDKILTKYGFPIGMKLGDLPKERVEYPLPDIDFHFLQTLQ